jgi:hypothetical protein
MDRNRKTDPIMHEKNLSQTVCTFIRKRYFCITINGHVTVEWYYVHQWFGSSVG